jgi:hypothetical protein
VYRDSTEPGTNFVALLRRWGDAGGVWRVLGHDRDKRARLGARLWQGLAQLCVSITRAERGNRIGALRLVGRARRRLATYAATGEPL